ncbi:reverse transcriptase [Gossypium australe]|uniref:Reverse transcriptase n=1 Tax=Gossypium australe TaxID=47621 RepID=A0A5B6X0F4_9ROSI|nr:reverse transcriptase [Gossypium australe]
MSGQVGDAPWLLGGDFNFTLSPEESSSFDALVREIEVFDHAYFGPIFIWSNHQLDRPIEKKLDRVLVNVAWIQFLPHSQNDRFLQLVAESWQPTMVGDPMLKLFTKLKILKHVLNMLNSKAFGNISARVKAKVEEMESL